MKKKNNFLQDNRLKIGANIRKWRNIKEVKQKDLAYALDLSEAAVSNIENDITDVTLSQLNEISSTLNIPVENLFCDPQETFVASHHSSVSEPSFTAGHLLEKELLNAMLSSIQKKDEQLQTIMQNVLHTMNRLLPDDKKFA